MTTSVTIQNRKSQIENPSESLMAAQLSAQYQKAVAGLVEQIKFGAMMMVVRSHVVSTRGHVDMKDLHITRGGLNTWMAENCPEISRPTAYRWMRMADIVKQEFQIGEKTDIVAILDEADGVTEKHQKLGEKIRAFIAGKSARQLLFDFSAGVGDPKPRGGAREGTHPESKMTPEELDAALIAAADRDVNDIYARLNQYVTEKHNWHLVHINRFLAFQSLLEESAKQIRIHLRQR